MTVTEKQLEAMLGWLDTTESADPELCEEIYAAWLRTPEGGSTTVSEDAVAEAVYYSENLAEQPHMWTRYDRATLTRLYKRLYPNSPV